MTFQVVNKRQSLYILLVSLCIASFSFITIHGINHAVTNTPLDPVSVDRVIDSVETKPSKVNTITPGLQATNVQPTNTEETLTAADTTCKRAGCNGELCLATEDVTTMSSCKNTEANKCYAAATCTVQNGGKCGWTNNATLTRCIADSNFATQTIRVLQIKFISDPLDVPYNPDDLSLQLRNALQTSSTYHKYKDTLAKPAVNVEVIENITVDGGRENVEDYWYGSYYNMIQDMGLCQKIKDNKIDQIWMWVDPRDTSSGPGLEYAISSKFFLKQNGDDAGVARPPFCEGEVSFVVMGFDYTATYANALHSFGHYMESMVQTVQNSELFARFEGTYNMSIQGRYACGNVHFPPNATMDYEYGNLTAKPTYCQTWDPNKDQSTPGIVLSSLNCETWGCNQAGYMAWWYQNMPGWNNPLTYQGRKIPSWWDFTVRFDDKIRKYNLDSTYYVDNNNYDINNVDLSSNCSCTGTDEFGQPITVTQCWRSIKGAGGNTCFTCTKDTFYQVPMLFCNN